MKSQERLRMNEAMSEKTMAEDIEQSEEREEEFNNVSEEMFNSTWEGDDDDTRQNSSIHLGVAYQTISADVSELKDKTNISEMMQRRIVSKKKKVYKVWRSRNHQRGKYRGDPSVRNKCKFHQRRAHQIWKRRQVPSQSAVHRA